MKVKKTYSIESQLAKKVRKLAFDKEVTASSLVEAALQIYVKELTNSEQAA